MNRYGVRSFIYFLVIGTLMILQIFVLEKESLGMGSNTEPTAIVVDADTAEPIEGAVAIAIWREHSIEKAAWFEGGTMEPVRIEEVVSDKEGKIYIDDFWDWHLFEERYPRLTIYKWGYVCWDQKFIYIDEFKSEKRHDFDEKNRIVKMKKRPKKFSFIGHGSFVDSCTMGDTHEAPKKLFRKAFESESYYEIQERTKRNKEKRENEKRRRQR